MTAKPAASQPVAMPAPAELCALAAATRPDWDPDVTAAALLAAQNAGWTWDRVLAETVRLLRSADGTPWDLRRAVSSPLRRAPVQPGTWQRGAALARELLDHGGMP